MGGTARTVLQLRRIALCGVDSSRPSPWLSWRRPWRPSVPSAGDTRRTWSRSPSNEARPRSSGYARREARRCRVRRVARVRGDGVVDRRRGRRPHAGGARRPRRVRGAGQRELHRHPGAARGGRGVPPRPPRGRGDLHGGWLRAGERARRRLQRPSGTRLHQRDDGSHRGGQEPHPAAAAGRRGARRGAALELPARPGGAGHDGRRGGRARALRGERGGGRRAGAAPRAGGAPAGAAQHAARRPGAARAAAGARAAAPALHAPGRRHRPPSPRSPR